MGSSICAARGDELGGVRLEAILALRVAVFVVEQECPYQEVDGRDTDPGTWHGWMTDEGEIVSYLRVLTEPGGVRRIGRVCTSASGRGRGRASLLMAGALSEIAGAPAVLDAQTYVRAFYERFGFVARGEEFVEDGIPHIAMARPGGPEGSTAGRPGPRRAGSPRSPE